MSMLRISIGYNMASTLQFKLPAADTLLVYDINTAATKKFVSEEQLLDGGSSVNVASSVREAVEGSVSCL